MPKGDLEFMELALNEAKEGYRRGDFPVGAVLTLDNKLVGKANNANYLQEDWNHHAETGVISRYSRLLKKARKEDRQIALYTTLEPCIMCLGTAIMNRVSRIVYACPDPNAGVCSADKKSFGIWYQRHWPKITALNGDIRENSYILLKEHMKATGTWTKILKQFERMHQVWKR